MNAMAGCTLVPLLYALQVENLLTENHFGTFCLIRIYYPSLFNFSLGYFFKRHTFISFLSFPKK